MTDRPCIYVLAGTNGAGKSSVVGATIFRDAGYFNPDEATKQIQAANPGASREEVNAEAWQLGVRLLRRAIAERTTFAFETTLGGRTIAGILEAAASSGTDVRVWFVGLESVERHIARVRSRVEQGGHDIPEERIRARYVQSRLNLIRLLPHLAELKVFDNSAERDPHAGFAPQPRLLVHMFRGKIVSLCEAGDAPEWAKPILMAALKVSAMGESKGRRA